MGIMIGLMIGIIIGITIEIIMGIIMGDNYMIPQSYGRGGLSTMF